MVASCSRQNDAIMRLVSVILIGLSSASSDKQRLSSSSSFFINPSLLGTFFEEAWIFFVFCWKEH